MLKKNAWVEVLVLVVGFERTQLSDVATGPLAAFVYVYVVRGVSDVCAAHDAGLRWYVSEHSKHFATLDERLVRIDVVGDWVHEMHDFVVFHSHRQNAEVESLGGGGGVVLLLFLVLWCGSSGSEYFFDLFVCTRKERGDVTGGSPHFRQDIPHRGEPPSDAHHTHVFQQQFFLCQKDVVK